MKLTTVNSKHQNILHLSLRGVNFEVEKTLVSLTKLVWTSGLVWASNCSIAPHSQHPLSSFSVRQIRRAQQRQKYPQQPDIRWNMLAISGYLCVQVCQKCKPVKINLSAIHRE